MTYAGQLRFADSDLEIHLSVYDSDLDRWAYLVAKRFENAVAVLLEARNGKPEQFAARVCYMHACRQRLQSVDRQKRFQQVWPKSHTVFGQYHRTGSSAIDVASKFADGLWAEIEVARLQAYPRQSVEHRELSELAEWPKTFWSELRVKRPELADWPAWSIHQERDRLWRAIGDELRKASSTSSAAPPAERTDADVSARDATKRLRSMSDASVLNFTQRELIALFRRWQSEPGENDLLKSGEHFCSSLARSHFHQEFDSVVECLFRVAEISRRLRVETTALRRFTEACRHYDFGAAERDKYDASADLQRVREASQAEAELPRNGDTESSELGTRNGSSANASESLQRLLDDLDQRAVRYPDYSGAVEVCPENDGKVRLRYYPTYEATMRSAQETERSGYLLDRKQHNRAVRSLDSIADRVNRTLRVHGVELPSGTTAGASLMAWVVSDQFTSPDGKYSRSAARPVGNPFEAIREKLLEVLEAPLPARTDSHEAAGELAGEQLAVLAPGREPPPAFDATSTDWVFGAALAKALAMPTGLMSDYRKDAEIDAQDQHGSWGVDCIGTFRRRVQGRFVAYYIPELKPRYRSAYEHSKKGMGG